MTATNELRRLLDERGVEYVLDDEYAEKYPPEQTVTWSCDIAGEDMTVTARDYFIGDGEYCLDLEFHEVFTPAQAVEATLGSSQRDEADRLRSALDDTKENARLIEGENEALRELVRIAGTYCVNGLCGKDDGCPLYLGKPYCALPDRMRELRIEVDE